MAICYTAARVVYSYFCPFICLVFPLVRVSLKVNKNLSECDRSQDPNLPVPRRRVSVREGGRREGAVLSHSVMSDSL